MRAVALHTMCVSMTKNTEESRVQILIWRSDGCIVVGETVEEAVFLMWNLAAACDHQVSATRFFLLEQTTNYVCLYCLPPSLVAEDPAVL